MKESGGKDAKIVVITTASSIPREVGENYMDAFTKLGCKNISIIDIREREQSDTPEFLQLITEATVSYTHLVFAHIIHQLIIGI